MSIIKNTASVLVSLVLLLFLFSNPAFSSDVWYQVFQKPFNQSQGDTDVLAMAELNGTLYVGTGRTDSFSSANIYRLVSAGCKLWDCVTPPWTNTGGYDMAMSVFSGKLYVGTDVAEVWRTSDGTNWTKLPVPWASGPGTTSVSDMAVFNGRLYVSLAGGMIFRTNDGVSWQAVVGPSPASTGTGFDDPRFWDLESLEVFNGNLYAGVGLSFEEDCTATVKLKGIQLWRTADGANWTKFQEVVEPYTNCEPGISAIYPEHVHAMKAFNGYLYVGEYHGGGLYRTDGSASSWDYIDAKIPGGGVFRMAEHYNELYLGMNDWFGNWSGTSLLYSSINGSTWSAVPGAPVVDSDTDAVGALFETGGTLYVGLEGRGSGLMEIWALGPGPAPECRIGDLKDGLGLGKDKIKDIAKLVNQGEWPDLHVPPPIGPVVPTSALEFSLITDIKGAVNGLDIDSVKKGEILEELQVANDEAVSAESMLYETASGDMDYQSEFQEEILDHLSNAEEACDDASSLLSSLVGIKADIKVNGSDGPLHLSHADVIDVTVSVDNSGLEDDADWWLAAVTPFGTWFYLYWPADWTQDWMPAYQGGLFYLAPFHLFGVQTSSLPSGTYTLYFGVDTVPDGRVTWDHLYYDTVDLEIE